MCIRGCGLDYSDLIIITSIIVLATCTYLICLVSYLRCLPLIDFLIEATPPRVVPPWACWVGLGSPGAPPQSISRLCLCPVGEFLVSHWSWWREGDQRNRSLEREREREDINIPCSKSFDGQGNKRKTTTPPKAATSNYNIQFYRNMKMLVNYGA